MDDGLLLDTTAADASFPVCFTKLDPKRMVFTFGSMVRFVGALYLRVIIPNKAHDREFCETLLGAVLRSSYKRCHWADEMMMPVGLGAQMTRPYGYHVFDPRNASRYGPPYPSLFAHLAGLQDPDSCLSGLHVVPSFPVCPEFEDASHFVVDIPMMYNVFHPSQIVHTELSSSNYICGGDGLVARSILEGDLVLYMGAHEMCCSPFRALEEHKADATLHLAVSSRLLSWNGPKQGLLQFNHSSTTPRGVFDIDHGVTVYICAIWDTDCEEAPIEISDVQLEDTVDGLQTAEESWTRVDLTSRMLVVRASHRTGTETPSLVQCNFRTAFPVFVKVKCFVAIYRFDRYFGA